MGLAALRARALRALIFLDSLTCRTVRFCSSKCIGPFCTDFNTRKIFEVILRNFGKKMFSLKSMTKLEDLTVQDHYVIGDFLFLSFYL
jgi:hypothetical protein